MVESAASQMNERKSRGFYKHLIDELRLVDLTLLVAVPVGLIAVFLFPDGTKQELAFEVANPSILDAYVSHFVHASDSHLVGNLAVFAIFGPLTYVVCILSGQRQTFRHAGGAFLLVFPFALSAMQLSFQTERLTFGFSGINAAFVGLLCFVLVRYVGRVLLDTSTSRYAPALLFTMFGLITLVSLPARAWRVELVAVSFGLAVLYLAATLYSTGLPSFDNFGDKGGYAELAGAGFGAVLMYPFVGFREQIIPGGGVIDVYIHLLGLALAFIVVFVFVVITEEG